MTVELMQTLSMVSFILAGVLFLVAAALFFLLDIRRVIGDVSGSTARKAIENIRQQNEETGNKAYKPSPVNMSRGRVTDKISPSGRLAQQTDPIGVAVGTSELNSSDVEYAFTASETTVLDVAQNVAYQAATSETTVLTQPTQMAFAVDYEIGFCGSSEIIE